MKLEIIKVATAFESKTNPRGKNFAGKDFDDLVASVKEKGVLVPVLARKSGKGYEVIAGSRRLRAAGLAGLKEIPAQVVEMTDIEAREAQIIENLQRADIHPLMEGEAYRQLIEKSKYEIAAVAAKVGKSQAYVRHRLLLTNLVPKLATMFRNDGITAGHAELVARLDEKQQMACLKFLTEHWQDQLPSIKDLKEWIRDRVYADLSRQPWKDEEKLKEAVGPCVECVPGKQDLFGQNAEDMCTDPACYARKMVAYIEIKIREAGEKGIKLIKVSNEYGDAPKGVVSRNDFKTVGKKDECDSVQPAIVVAGHHTGTILNVCWDEKCKVHQGSHTPYKRTAKEIAEAKKQREEEAKKKEKEAKEFAEGLSKVKFPLSKQQMSVLLSVLLGNGSNTTQPICKRRGIVVEKTKSTSGYEHRDFGAALRKASEKMSDTEKMQLVFELVFATTWIEDMKSVFKKL